MFFGYKYVETGPNCSHELSTFLKYHMPLSGTRDRKKNLFLHKFSYNNEFFPSQNLGHDKGHIKGLL